MPNSSQANWNDATVAEPTSSNESTAIFSIPENTSMILSLDPAEDFELNTNLITEYRLVFQNARKETIGTCDYFDALDILAPYTIASQNGSILLSPLTSDEMQQLIAQTIFE